LTASLSKPGEFHLRPKSRAKALIATFLSIFILLGSTIASTVSPALAQADSRPSLVLVIVADAFSYNYLSRYRDKFQGGGFKMLMDQGAHFTDCRLKCATSLADVGSSVIATGAYPWNTGIVGDKWYSRGKKQFRSATSDDNAALVGANGTAGSNKNVNGTTFGDQLRLASNGRSKVFSAGVTQSSSLILGGRLANNAFWIDEKTGAMVTSSKYGTTLPAWVSAFNDQHVPDQSVGKTWQRLQAEINYSASTRDDYPRERGLPGDGRVFPHNINAVRQNEDDAAYTVFTMTPAANQMIMDFARDAIDKEYLGQHPDPDCMIIGLNAGEKLTQYFGPYSHETQDLVLRMDQSLASLFQFIETKVGLRKTLVVFTASHGAALIPEFAQERALDAGRIDPSVFTSFIDKELDARLGAGNWVEAFEAPNLYLNLDEIDRQKLRQPDVESLVSKVAHGVPGIGEILTAWQLYTNQPPSSPLLDEIKRSYYFGRSGEVYVAPRPGYVFAADANGTGYGSPHTYDSQVPLLMYGAGIKGGKYNESVWSADIAATITSALEIETPSLCEGKPIKDAFGGSSSLRR